MKGTGVGHGPKKNPKFFRLFHLMWIKYPQGLWPIIKQGDKLKTSVDVFSAIEKPLTEA